MLYAHRSSFEGHLTYNIDDKAIISGYMFVSVCTCVCVFHTRKDQMEITLIFFRIHFTKYHTIFNVPPNLGSYYAPEIQQNLSQADTYGAEQFVRYKQVST